MSDTTTDPAAAEDGVWVDSLGTPGRTDDRRPVTVALIGGSEATRRRLEAEEQLVLADADGGEEDAATEPVEVVFVSTRLPRNEAIAAVNTSAATATVVALVHTGGERLAAELLRAGAAGLLAEGNEAAVGSFLHRDGRDTGLLEVYDQQVGRSYTLSAGGRTRDSVTGLPDRTAFEARITDAAMSGDLPRIGLIRVLFLAGGSNRASQATIALVRRRLAHGFSPIAAAFQTELFAIDANTFAVVGDELSPNLAQELGLALGAVAGGFAPWGRPLAVALGHAGSEVSQDPATVRQLAERAMEVAAGEQRNTVVGAETLSLGASSTTELEAALRLVDLVERHDPLGPGQSTAIADLATAIALELGYEGLAGSAIRLAAHLHDVGKVSLPVEAMFDDDLPEDLVPVHRSHPTRGADYLRPLVGDDIAAAVRAHHERWDGAGFPDGLSGSDIPVAARIIAIAEAFVRRSAEHGVEEALEHLQDAAGGAYDPSIVEAALPVLLAGSAQRVSSVMVPSP